MSLFSILSTALRDTEAHFDTMSQIVADPGRLGPFRCITTAVMQVASVDEPTAKVRLTRLLRQDGLGMLDSLDGQVAIMCDAVEADLENLASNRAV